MLEEQGTVVAVVGERARVAVQRKSTCGSCAAKGCGTGTLAQLLGGRANVIEVRNALDAAVGETVVLGIDEDTVVKGSVTVYLLPLLTLFAGALFGEWMAPQLAVEASDPLAIVGGIAGFTAGLLWVRQLSQRLGTAGRFETVMLRHANEAALVSIPVNLNR